MRPATRSDFQIGWKCRQFYPRRRLDAPALFDAHLLATRALSEPRTPHRAGDNRHKPVRRGDRHDSPTPGWLFLFERPAKNAPSRTADPRMPRPASDPFRNLDRRRRERHRTMQGGSRWRRPDSARPLGYPVNYRSHSDGHRIGILHKIRCTAWREYAYSHQPPRRRGDEGISGRVTSCWRRSRPESSCWAVRTAPASQLPHRACFAGRSGLRSSSTPTRSQRVRLAMAVRARRFDSDTYACGRIEARKHLQAEVAQERRGAEMDPQRPARAWHVVGSRVNDRTTRIIGTSLDFINPDALLCHRGQRQTFLPKCFSSSRMRPRKLLNSRSRYRNADDRFD